MNTTHYWSITQNMKIHENGPAVYFDMKTIPDDQIKQIKERDYLISLNNFLKSDKH